MLILNQSLLAKSHEQNCLFLMIICVKADYEQQFRLLFSRHNVLQISEPDYLCLRLNKEFSSVFHLMRCQSRSLWCYNYYGNKKIPKKMPHGQNIISSCRNSQRHKFNVLDSIHHFFSSFFLKYILTLTVICNDSNPFFVYLITVLYFCHVFTKELFYSVMLILRRENKLYFCD